MTQRDEAFIRALELEIAANTEHPAYDRGLQKALDFARAMLVGGAEQQLREALELAETEMRYAGWKILDVENVGRESAYRHVCKALALPAGQPDEGVEDDGLAVEDITEDLKAYIRSLPIKADLEKCAEKLFQKKFGVHRDWNNSISEIEKENYRDDARAVISAIDGVQVDE